jgi:hypothetical protein
VVAVVRLEAADWDYPGAGAWDAAFFLPQPTMPPLISPQIVRVARDAPIVRVAHGWGGGVEA